MGTIIYQDYGDEPEPLFVPLDAERACALYAEEMADFCADLAFYELWLPDTGELLELGCGNGRLTRLLARPQRPVTGLDISWPMLQLARQELPPSARLVQMDMRAMAFTRKFAALLIPYNTLNLLVGRDALRTCLDGCHRLLAHDGLLLAQIYLPGNTLAGRRGRTFQFQILQRPQGGRVIKEVLRRYRPETATVEVEERFRIRPQGPAEPNEELIHQYVAAALTAEEWFSLFTGAGFRILHCCSDYDLNPWRSEATTLLVVLAAKKDTENLSS